jgi:hypothetical protein
MDEESNNLKDTLSTIDPVSFHWDENTVAQDTNSSIPSTVSLDTIDLNSSAMYDTISITGINNVSGTMMASASSGPIWTTNTIIGASSNIGSGLSINNLNDKSYIKTKHHEIDLDELGELMATLKERLLILTPNFEKHEKYPMLKQMYDEYKAMERLLSGPDSE